MPYAKWRRRTPISTRASSKAPKRYPESRWRRYWNKIRIAYLKHFVFMIPVACELDLKKAARAAGEKSIAMVKSRDLLGLTGYIHGGCSPVGMEKLFPTFIDETAELYDPIMFSGGRIGCQIQTPLSELQRVVPVKCVDLTVV